MLELLNFIQWILRAFEVREKLVLNCSVRNLLNCEQHESSGMYENVCFVCQTLIHRMMRVLRSNYAWMEKSNAQIVHLRCSSMVVMFCSPFLSTSSSFHDFNQVVSKLQYVLKSIGFDTISFFGSNVHKSLEDNGIFIFMIRNTEAGIWRETKVGFSEVRNPLHRIHSILSNIVT